MEYLQPVLLGVLQGVTEFLPISSSGHLVLFPFLVGWEYQGLAFDVVVHLGTLLAIMVVFWKRFFYMAWGFYDQNKHPMHGGLLRTIALATLPAVLVGYFFADFIETTLRTPQVVVGGLILGSLFLWLADRATKKHKNPIDDAENILLEKGVAVGFAQILALIPGVSRSGVTMSAGVGLNIDRARAAEFSFLLGAPVFLGAGLYKVGQLMQQGDWVTALLSPTMIIGFFAALITGILTIKVLMKFLQTQTFTVFIVYRLLLAAIVIGVLL